MPGTDHGTPRPARVTPRTTASRRSRAPSALSAPGWLGAALPRQYATTIPGFPHGSPAGRPVGRPIGPPGPDSSRPRATKPLRLSTSSTGCRPWPWWSSRGPITRVYARRSPGHGRHRDDQKRGHGAVRTPLRMSPAKSTGWGAERAFRCLPGRDHALIRSRGRAPGQPGNRRSENVAPTPRKGCHDWSHKVGQEWLRRS